MVLAEQQGFYDVEINIYRSTYEGYQGDMQLPDGNRVPQKLAAPPLLNLERASGPRRYGTELFEWLFQGQWRDAFTYARSFSRSPGQSVRDAQQVGLRLRLSLDPQALPLHSLRWECLYDASMDQLLSLTTAFTRYIRMSVPRRGTIYERPLRMLLIAANPHDAALLNLEQTIVQRAMRSFDTLLQVERLSGPATPENITNNVSRNYHIVHLLSCSVKKDNKDYIILEDPNGQSVFMGAEEIVQVVMAASYETFLVFLSVPAVDAGSGDEPAKPSLPGVVLPQAFMRAGAQAVITMQVHIDPTALQAFTSRFYEVLIQTGLVDVAVAEGRAAIFHAAPDRWDWSLPILYMRTPDAQLFQPLPDALEARVRGSVRR